MWTIIKTVLILSAIAFVLGILLGIAAKVFRVKKDEREEKILECLPGANCGGCGYAGCSAYASAIVSDGAPVNKCSVGGSPVSEQIAQIMGVEAGKTVRMRAQVMCRGKEGTAKYKYEYKGIMDCAGVARLGNGSKECPNGCIGLGACLRACPFGAISIKEGIAEIDPDKCRACGMCVTSCPQHIIRLIPYESHVWVSCSNRDKGINTRKYCDKGCIGCHICEKNCPTGAITVKDNFASIDYSKCTDCGLCATKCPRGLIIDRRGVALNDIPS